MEGIINVRKEKGYTSFDVVAVLRGILHEKKIGHCGTLDPDAEGVLVVCTGHATKLVDLLTAHEKTYETVLRLGITTDTQDTSGEILTRKEVGLTEEEIRAAVRSFVGEIEQIPPMYSAIKVNGKKLYELARAGKEAERKPRRVYISQITVDKIDLPDVFLTVHCSKGTYIRTLCEDIGNKLGCGGAMASLKRTKSGAFSIEDAWTLDEIRKEMRRFEKDADPEKMNETRQKAASDPPAPAFLKPLDSCFYYLPSVKVKGNNDFLVRNGNPVRFSRNWFQEAPKKDSFLRESSLLSDSGLKDSGLRDSSLKDSGPQEEPEEKEMLRVYLEDGTFAGVYEYRADKQFWKPWKMFISAK